MINDFIAGLLLVFTLDLIYLFTNEDIQLINGIRFVFSLPYTFMGFAISFFLAIRSTLNLSESLIPLIIGIAFTLILALISKKLNKQLDSSAEKNIIYYGVIVGGIFISSSITLYTLFYLYDIIAVKK